MKNMKTFATLTAYAFLAAFLTAVLAIALVGRFIAILSIVMFCTLQSPTQTEKIDNTVTVEPVAPVATVTPIAPILSIVPDMEIPLENLNKNQLRGLCRVKGIQYSKMTVGQMRQALSA